MTKTGFCMARTMAASIPYSDPSRPEQDLLLRLARKYRARKVHVARGTCFSASLDLAREAQRQGVAAVLLSWRVRGDSNFVDHWAVWYGDAMAIDLTSAQFDSEAPLLYPLGNYPRSFDRLRAYPASLFLRRYAASKNAGSPRLERGFMLHAGLRMWRHDTSRALRDCDPITLVSVHLRLGRLVVVLGLQQLRELARQRLKMLLGRLR